MKKCLNCGKQLIFPKFTANNYLKSNFRLKKFCNEACRIKLNNRKKKKSYILKETEHNNKLKELNNLIKGKMVVAKGRKDSYYPDIIKDNVDYELEIFRRIVHLKNKVERWDSSRKHILVISISDQTRSLFDEVYLFINKNLIKEK